MVLKQNKCLKCLQIHVVFHQPHSSISRPAFLIVVAYNVFIVGVGMLSQVPLDQISCLVSREPEFKETKSLKRSNTVVKTNVSKQTALVCSSDLKKM